MESFEALLAFMVFLTILSFFLPTVDVDSHYTLPQYLIAEDIWRVMYLKHGLAFFYPLGPKAPEVSADLDLLAEMTGLCIEYEAPNFHYTSPYCPPRSGNVIAISQPRMVGENVLKVS